MNKANRKYISTFLMALVILQSVPVLSITASASTVLNQGGVSDSIQWSVIVDDDGKKVLKITGTGVIPAQTPGAQAWVSYATDVVRLEISEGITSINVGAFSGSIPNVTEIILPSTLQAIYNNAFNGCKVTEISLGENVKTMGDNPFSGIMTLETINVDTGNTVFKSIDGVLYNSSSRTLVSYPRGKTASVLNIPNSIASIGTSALAGNTYITTVTGKNVTGLYDYCFADCVNLTSVDLPNANAVRPYAYKNCYSLKKAFITPSININVYYNCTGLEEIEISGAAVATTIADNIISGELSTNDIVLRYAGSICDETCIRNVTQKFNVVKIVGIYGSPAHNVAIADGIAFEDLEVPISGSCGENVTYDWDSATKTLTLSGTGSMYDYDDVSGSPLVPFLRLNNLVIEEGITHIGKNCLYVLAYNNVSADNQLVFPTTLESCDNTNFSYTRDCKKLVLSKNMNEFMFPINCVDEIVVPDDSVYFKKIDGMVISESDKTLWRVDKSVSDNLVVPEGIEIIGTRAFRYSDVVTLDLPSTLTKMHAGAIDLMENLQSIDFDKCTKLSRITNMFLRYLPNVTEIDLTNTALTTLTVDSLSNNTALKILKLPKTLTSMHSSVLNGVTLTEIWMPVKNSILYANGTGVMFLLSGTQCWKDFTSSGKACVDYDAGLEGNYKYSDNLKQAVSYNSESQALYITGKGTVDLSQFMPDILSNAGKSSLTVKRIEIAPTVTDVTNVTGLSVLDGVQLFVYPSSGTFTEFMSLPNLTVFGYAGSDVSIYCSSENIVFYPLQSCGTNAYWYMDIDTGSLNIIGSGDITAYTEATVPWSVYLDADQIHKIYIDSEITDIPDATLQLFSYDTVFLAQSNRDSVLAEHVIASGHHYVDATHTLGYSELSAVKQEGDTWWSLETDPVDASKTHIYLQKYLTAAQRAGIGLMSVSPTDPDAYYLSDTDKSAILALGSVEFDVVFTDGFTKIADDGLSNLTNLTGTVTGISVYGDNAVSNTGISAIDWDTATVLGKSALANTNVTSVVLKNIESVGARCFDDDDLSEVVSYKTTTIYDTDAFTGADLTGAKVYDIEYNGNLSSVIPSTVHVYTRNDSLSVVGDDVILIADTECDVDWKYTGDNPNAVAFTASNGSISIVNVAESADKRYYTISTKIVPDSDDSVIVSYTADAVSSYVVSLSDDVEIGSSKATPAFDTTVLSDLSVSSLTYGDALSDSIIICGLPKYNGIEVAGTFAWKTPDAIPSVSDSNSTPYTIVFIPTADDYNAVEIPNVTLTVNKAAPIIQSLSATGIVYLQSLSDSTLSGVAVYNSSEVSGEFDWLTPTICPTVADSNVTDYAVVFIPDDTVNYDSVDTTCRLVVSKADIVFSDEQKATVQAGDIVYFDTLADSSVTGISPIAGEFEWLNTDLAPSVADSDITEYVITFIPTDTDNYNVYTELVSRVHVDPYQITLTDEQKAAVSSESLSYGQTLSESSLSGPSVYNSKGDEIPGHFEWVSPDTVPNVGSGSSSAYAVRFVPDDTANILYSETFAVSVTVDQRTVNVDDIQVTASSLIVGDTLSQSQIIADCPVAGHWEWVNGNTKYTRAGTFTAQAQFVPDSDQYAISAPRSVSVNVMPYTINCGDYHLTASDISKDQTLSASVLSQPDVTNSHGDKIEGQWVWVYNNATYTRTGVFTEQAVFVPADSDSYIIVGVTDVEVTVCQRLIDVSDIKITVSALTVGDTLSQSQITAQCPIDGHWEWVNGDTKYTRAGTFDAQVQFIPDDDLYATPVPRMVSVIVMRYEIKCSDYHPTASSIVKGQELSKSVLSQPDVTNSHGDKIEGQWMWQDEHVSYDRVGTYVDAAVFVPVDGDSYVVTGAAEVEVKVRSSGGYRPVRPVKPFVPDEPDEPDIPTEEPEEPEEPDIPTEEPTEEPDVPTEETEETEEPVISTEETGESEEPTEESDEPIDEIEVGPIQDPVEDLGIGDIVDKEDAPNVSDNDNPDTGVSDYVKVATALAIASASIAVVSAAIVLIKRRRRKF